MEPTTRELWEVCDLTTVTGGDYWSHSEIDWPQNIPISKQIIWRHLHFLLLLELYKDRLVHLTI